MSRKIKTAPLRRPRSSFTGAPVRFVKRVHEQRNQDRSNNETPQVRGIGRVVDSERANRHDEEIRRQSSAEGRCQQSWSQSAKPRSENDRRKESNEWSDRS